MECPHCGKETSTKFKVYSWFNGKLRELWFDLEELGLVKKEKEDA